MTTSHFHLSDALLQRPTNSTLLVAVVWIINHLYAGYTNSLTLSLWSRTAFDDSLQTELLSEILPTVRENELTYVIENSEDIQCGEIVAGGSSDSNDCLLRENVLLMVDSFDAFLRLFKKQLRKRNFLISGFYTILYMGSEQPYYDVILKIFHELFAIYLTNVNIVIELSEETLVYSYYPFTQYHCHAATPVLHNRFTKKDGFIFQKPFFPKKNDNFYGCFITVATWNGPPFVFFQNNSQGELTIRGVEGALIRMLSIKMNFTIKLLRVTSRGSVFPNLTASTGAVKSIIDGKANVTINSFVYSKYSLRAMLASYTYISYPIIVAVPRGQPMSPFQRLMRPFKYIIWSCLSSSVLAGISLIFIIKCLRKKTVSDFVFGPFNSTPFTNLLNVFFGGPVSIIPQRNFARYILLVWLWYTMILRNAYTGELFFMLQDSTSRTSLKDIDQLVERNFTLWCTENTLEILRRSTHAHRMEVIKGLPFPYLAKLHDSNSNLAVVILRPFLRLYNRVVRGKPPIRTLPGALLTMPLAMYFRRNSYLHEIVNAHLMRFMASGLMKIWDQFYLPKEDVMLDQVGGEPTVLSVQLLMGLFSVYLFFLSVSILVFAMEIWSKYSPICHSVVDFLNY